MKKSRIGVIVPVYNTKNYLRQCIESILQQSFHDISIVIVDDGSTDGSRYLCDVYDKKDTRITVVHQENKGIMSALFTGIKNLECDYVNVVDSDDWIDPNTYNLMREYMDGEFDMITYQIIRWYSVDHQHISNSLYLEGKKEKKEIEEMYKNMIWDIEKNQFGFDPSLCNKLIKYEYLYQELKDATVLDIHYGQDISLVYPVMYKIQSLAMTDRPLYYHRQRKKGEIPSYISDPYFYKKITELYSYLVRKFDSNTMFVKQLDYMFCNEVKKRLNCYGDKRIKNRYRFVFPFSKVDKGDKIIIYGASEKGQEYAEQLMRTGYAHLVLWVDQEYDKITDFNVNHPSEIMKMDSFDKIIIATIGKSVAERIMDELSQKGLDKKKMIWIE